MLQDRLKMCNIEQLADTTFVHPKGQVTTEEPNVDGHYAKEPNRRDSTNCSGFR